MNDKGINVLSLFDGMSCGRIALERAGIKVYRYYASEIDKHAIKVSLDNWFDVVQIGSVVDLSYKDGILSNRVTGFSVKVKIDLLIGGSPCQGFSFAGKQLNFDDPRSALFFEYVRLWNEIEAYNPDAKFLLENVKMKKEYEAVITDYLFVKPVEINSALVSAQNRKRLYWTNLGKLSAPVRKNITLFNIMEDKVGHMFDHSDKAIDYMDRPVKGGRSHWDFAHHSDSRNDKSSCITSSFKKGVPYNVLIDRRTDVRIRKFTPIECERLQTVPDNYTRSAADIHRYSMLGNGWTVDVIVHIFSFYKP